MHTFVTNVVLLVLHDTSLILQLGEIVQLSQVFTFYINISNIGSGLIPCHSIIKVNVDRWLSRIWIWSKHTNSERRVQSITISSLMQIKNEIYLYRYAKLTTSTLYWVFHQLEKMVGRIFLIFFNYIGGGKHALNILIY